VKSVTSINARILELLELIASLEARGKPVRPDDLTSELRHLGITGRELIETALNNGLIERTGETLVLSDKGRMEVQRHREHYIHDKYAHRSGLIGRATRFLEGSVQDWRDHWRRKHGFDEAQLRSLQAGLRDLEGRIEETSSLADLHPGESGIVVFALGGHGLVRRVAEMGLTPGSIVKVVRSAPFRGPIEISVRGVSLALGRGVASKIFVRRCKEGA